MEKGCDILLYGTMGQIGPDIASGLSEDGLKVEVADFPQNTFHDEWGYRRGLVKAVDRFSPAMVMPVGDTLAASRAKDILEGRTVLAVEEERKIRTLGSKVQSSALAAGLGIRLPHIYEDTGEAEDAMSSGVQIVFKRDISFGGHGVHLPRNLRSLDNLIAHQSPGEPYLMQEWIDGYDCSIDVLRWDGFFYGGCYRTVKRKGNGPATQRESIVNEAVISAARKILDSLNFHGVCGMDFRVDGQGREWFLECNPRFTGGTAAQREVGFDLPFLYWKLASGQCCAASDITFREGITTG